jgi:hypothetical protein
MKISRKSWSVAAVVALLTLAPGSRVLHASSHMDAPLITLDPAANETDVYAFRTNQVTASGTTEYLTVSLAVYPFEEPGIGPNNYRFDDNVLYSIDVSTGADLTAGLPTYEYQFRFKTTYKDTNTIAQAFLGPIVHVGDSNQNLTQTYTVTKITRRTGRREVLFSNILVPPNNQGLLTNLYNQGNSGEMPAREGVASFADLDSYTQQTIYPPEGGTNPPSTGYQVFSGQRSDGFYADIQSIFDLDLGFTGPNKPYNTQAGFNLHEMVLNIPVTELGGDRQVVGVYGTTSRQQVKVLRVVPANSGNAGMADVGPFVQVGREGNPLFCEALVAIEDKDRYNETSPSVDAKFFKKYALAPELAVLLGLPQNLQTNRTDLAGIFIPDMIKTDLSTGPVLLAGGTNSAAGAVPDDAGFNRLGIFGGGPNMAGGASPDVLHSAIGQGFLGAGVQPGGWPNGRRFGDDVVDIAVLAVASDLRDPVHPTLATAPADPGVDKVDHNDIGYNKTFPYAPTPHNGRDHTHDTSPQ